MRTTNINRKIYTISLRANTLKIVKKDIIPLSRLADKFFKTLTPKEIKFYNSMSKFEKTSISISPQARVNMKKLNNASGTLNGWLEDFFRKSL